MTASLSDKPAHDTIGFPPEEYAHTAKLLRSDNEKIVRATLSNNYNIVLSALDRASCHDELLELLQMFVNETVSYMTINSLGDPEKQHAIKNARAAIARATGAA